MGEQTATLVKKPRSQANRAPQEHAPGRRAPVQRKAAAPQADAPEKEAPETKASHPTAPAKSLAGIPVFPTGENVNANAPASPSFSLPIQRKLAIGSVNDPMEGEANRVAQHVMRGSASRRSLAALPARSMGECRSRDAQTQTLPTIAAREPNTSDAPAIVHDVLRSPGEPLDRRSRDFFEPRFGYDFSPVRVHAGMHAATSASAVNAHAYTVGSDVVFGARRYEPNTVRGRALLAHELTHVTQATPRLRRQISTTLASPAELEEFGGQEKEFLDEYGQALAPDVKLALAGLNLDAGFMVGFLDELAKLDLGKAESMQKDLRNPKNGALLMAGEFVGLLIGIGEDIYGQLEGLYDIGAFLIKQPAFWAALIAGPVIVTSAMIAQFLSDPKNRAMAGQIVSGLWDFYKEIQSNPGALLGVGEGLGRVVGKIARDWYSEKIISEPDYYWKGVAMGEILGIIATEIALLLLAPEELIAKGGATAGRGAVGAAKGAARLLQESRFAESIAKVLEKVPALERLMKVARETEKAAEVARDVEKGAQVVEKTAEVAKAGETVPAEARKLATETKAASAADVAKPAAKPELRSIKGGGETTPKRVGHLADVNKASESSGVEREFTQAAANEDVEQQVFQKAVGDPATENARPTMQRQGTGPQASSSGKGTGPTRGTGGSGSALTGRTTTPARGTGGTEGSRRLSSVRPNTVPEPYPILPKGLSEENYSNAQILEFFRKEKANYPSEIQKMIDDIHPEGMKKTPLRDKLAEIDRRIRDLHTQEANRLAGYAKNTEKPFVKSVRGASNEGGEFSSLVTDNKRLTLHGQLMSGGTAEFDSVEFVGNRILETKMNLDLKTPEEVFNQMMHQAAYARDYGFSELRWEVWDEEGVLKAQAALEDLRSYHPDLAGRVKIFNPNRAW